jgi:hypothetical protein
VEPPLGSGPASVAVGVGVDVEGVSARGESVGDPVSFGVDRSGDSVSSPRRRPGPSEPVPRHTAVGTAAAPRTASVRLRFTVGGHTGPGKCLLWTPS